VVESNFLKESMSTQQPKPFNVLLIGDTCEDIYVYGRVDRISPEAPVPVFVPVYNIFKDGMAGNVRKNLEALGCDVTFLRGQTSKKRRFIDERSKQHLMRVDEDVESEPIAFETYIPNVYDAVVISDYNKGTVTYELIEELAREVKAPVFIDTKKTDLARMGGCYVKINALELSRVTSYHPEPERLIVTHGDGGAIWNGWVYPAEKVGDVTDVCGAGDTFLAALVYEFLQTNSMPRAITFANKAAAVTVQHVGVYAPRLDEIQGENNGKQNTQ
jgi:D-beta-D-heptose 7-phosphate kinase/D-beta-D-heptose 1-phosphate adenosyltransferase